jgi:hypothetical protein
MKLTGHVARLEEMRNACNILIGMPRHRLECSNRLWFPDVDLIPLAQDRDQFWVVLDMVGIPFRIKSEEFLD